MTTDPIADMLTQIRNAIAVKKSEISLRHSMLKENLANVFEHEGWIKKVEATGDGTQKMLRLELRYSPNGSPSITGIWGTWLIWASAVLTVWSMVYYLQKALPEIRARVK